MKTRKQKQKTQKNKKRNNRKNFIGGGTIPKQIHQIWFGSQVPELRKPMFEYNELIAKRNGYTYKLWTESDRTETSIVAGKQIRTNFPMTWGYQEEAIKQGKEIGQNRMAQVADLARLEILYIHGGIYIDSLFEISDEFLKAVEEAGEKGFTFIGANEDPCDLDCMGANNQKYLTNSFIATSQEHPVMERLLDESLLNDIDFGSQFINRTTGPYYLRNGIQDALEDKVFLFQSNQIYPFSQQASKYQKERQNACLFREEGKEGEKDKEDKEGKGRIKVKEGSETSAPMYLKQQCLKDIQKNFIENEVQRLQEQIKLSKIDPVKFLIEQKGPLAIYHSGLGGSWSW